MCGCNSGSKDLEAVAGWLMVNGLKSEQSQADMLLMQNLDNIPRKFSYRNLLQKALAGTLSTKHPDTPRLLKGWALEVDLEIANHVHVTVSLMEVANLKIADAETGGLLDEEDCLLAHQIFAKQFSDPNDDLDAPLQVLLPQP